MSRAEEGATSVVEGISSGEDDGAVVEENLFEAERTGEKGENKRQCQPGSSSPGGFRRSMHAFHSTHDRRVGEEWHRRPFRATLKGFDEMFDVVQLTPVSGSLRVSGSTPTPAE